MMENILKNINNLLKYKENNKSFLGKKTERNNFDEHIKSKNKNNKQILQEKKDNSSFTQKENIIDKKNTYNIKKNINISTNENNENFIINFKENKHKYNTIGPNIINFISKKVGNYSYKLISRIYNFEIRQEEKNEENFNIVLKNDGENKWLENESYLICRKTNCPEVIINNIKLKPLDIDEIESFQIKFSNLKKCPKGKYRAAFSIVINNNIIKDKDNAEIFLIHFNII